MRRHTPATLNPCQQASCRRCRRRRRHDGTALLPRDCQVHGQKPARKIQTYTNGTQDDADNESDAYVVRMLACSQGSLLLLVHKRLSRLARPKNDRELSTPERYLAHSMPRLLVLQLPHKGGRGLLVFCRRRVLAGWVKSGCCAGSRCLRKCCCCISADKK